MQFFPPLGWLVFMVVLTGLRITQETHCWVCLGGCFPRGLTEEGKRHCVGITIPWAGVLDGMKRSKQARHQRSFFRTTDALGGVSDSCCPPSHCDGAFRPQIQTNISFLLLSFLPSLGCPCQVFSKLRGKHLPQPPCADPQASFCICLPHQLS